MRGSHPVQWWSEMILRVSDLSTLMFAALMDGALQVMGPYCRAVQKRSLGAAQKRPSKAAIEKSFQHNRGDTRVR